MTSLTILHNPRCSKSRQTLALIEERGITPEVIHYLEQPPTQKALKAILQKLGISARDLLRKGEQEYKELNLADNNLKEADLIRAMCQHPKLIERPIVIQGEKACLGRPPENVLELL